MARPFQRPLVASLILGITMPFVSGAHAAPSAAPEPSVIDDPQLLEAIERTITTSSSGIAKVRVEVLHSGNDGAIRNAITAAGGSVSGAVDGHLVEALIPVDGLDDVNAVAGVSYVRAPRVRPSVESTRPQPRQGSLDSEAVAALRADLWHAAGKTGTGSKIAVLGGVSSSMLSSQIALGDLPASITFRCLNTGSTCSNNNDNDYGGFGNILLEIIHDIAPGASLTIADFYTDSDQAAILEQLGASGVRVVVDPYTYYLEGPGNGTGPKQAAVEAAVNKWGMLYIKSAGNENQRQYWRGAWSDPDSDGYLNFSGTDETMAVTTTSSGQCWTLLGLRWSDWGAAATRTNYDLEIYYGTQRVYPNANFPAPNQTTGAPAVEGDGIGDCSIPASVPVSFKVRKRTAGTATTTGDIIELNLLSGFMEHWRSGYTATTPVTDSKHPYVVSVGAVTLPTPGTLDPWSSRGPTIDGRIKPEFVSYSCISTTIDSSCAEGTYFSAAVAGGVAALFNGAVAPNNVTMMAMLKRYAVDRGAVGADNDWGRFGQVALPAAPTTVNAAASKYTPIAPTRLLDSRNPLKSPPKTAGRYERFSTVDIPIANQAVPGSSPAVIPVPANATAVAVNVTVVGGFAAGYTQLSPYLSAKFGSSSTLNVVAANQTQPNFAIVPLSRGRISLYTTSGGSHIVDILGYFTPSGSTAAGRLVPLDPTRVLDTQSADPNLLPTTWTAHTPAAGETITYDFRDTEAMPLSDAAAVVVNVTGVSPTTGGHVTVYPTGQTAPVASTINLTAGGGNRTNQIIVPLGTASSIDLFTSSATNLQVDLVGYITNGSVAASTAGRFVSLSPGRVFDSRTPSSPLTSAAPRTITLGAPVPTSNVAAVSFNVTTASQTSAGAATVYPAGLTPAPTATTNSWPAANFSIAAGHIGKVTAGGGSSQVAAAVTATAHLILDVNGYFTAA